MGLPPVRTALISTQEWGHLSGRREERASFKSAQEGKVRLPWVIVAGHARGRREVPGTYRDKGKRVLESPENRMPSFP